MKIVKKVAHYTHNLDKKPEGYTNEITYNLQGNNTFQIIFGRTFNMHNKCHLCSFNEWPIDSQWKKKYYY